jgi:isocitrate/isopropylmalate dehydrogenase
MMGAVTLKKTEVHYEQTLNLCLNTDAVLLAQLEKNHMMIIPDKASSASVLKLRKELGLLLI